MVIESRDAGSQLQIMTCAPRLALSDDSNRGLPPRAANARQLFCPFIAAADSTNLTTAP